MVTSRKVRDQGTVMAIGLAALAMVAAPPLEAQDLCGSGFIAPPTLPPAMVGVAYSQQLTVDGTFGGFSFRLSDGTLPPGISLSATGLISGTPTQQDLYTFSITATERSECLIDAKYELLVEPEAMDVMAGGGLGQPNPNRVRLYGVRGRPAPVDFYAYAAGHWGVNVAAGNVDGGAYDELLTGPGPGPTHGPVVAGFRRDGSPIGKIRYFAYGTMSHGVNLAAGSLDPDPYDEIATGPGPGEPFGPQVRGWNFDGTRIGAMVGFNFFAYQTLHYGVNVGTTLEEAGDVEGIVTGPGPGIVFAPLVRDFRRGSGDRLAFWAFPVLQYGVVLAGGDVDGEGEGDIACTPGPGPDVRFPSQYRAFRSGVGRLAMLPGFEVTGFSTHYGGRLGVGDLDATGRENLIIGAGRDPSADSTVKTYDYDGSGLIPRFGAFLPFASSGYGVNVTGARCGY